MIPAHVLTGNYAFKSVSTRGILGLLTEPISLAYSREKKNLLRYQGISNIRNAEGGTLAVDILYRYEDTRVVGAFPLQSEKATFNF